MASPQLPRTVFFWDGMRGVSHVMLPGACGRKGIPWLQDYLLTTDFPHPPFEEEKVEEWVVSDAALELHEIT